MKIFRNKQNGKLCKIVGNEMHYISQRVNHIFEFDAIGEKCQGGTYELLTTSEAKKQIKENIKASFITEENGVMIWDNKNKDFNVRISIDKLSPAGEYQVQGGGYHTYCGCGSPEKNFVLTDKSTSIRDVLYNFAMGQRAWSCYGSKRYSIKSISR